MKWRWNTKPFLNIIGPESKGEEGGEKRKRKRGREGGRKNEDKPLTLKFSKFEPPKEDEETINKEKKSKRAKSTNPAHAD